MEGRKKTASGDLSSGRTAEEWMDLALCQAKKAYSAGEVPVGAVVARKNEILSKAFNQTEQKKDHTAHAELLAIQAAEQRIGDSLSECTLYVTMEPCPMCLGAALNARVKRIVFGAYDERAGCCGSVVDFASGWFPQSTEVIGGVKEKECINLLKGFFEKQRIKD